MIAIILAVAFSLFGTAASADIYRYLNDEGVECFTDTPTVRNAVRIAKEKKVSRKNVSNQVSPAAEPAREKTWTVARVSHATSTPLLDTDHDLPVRGQVTSPVGLRHDPIDGIIRDHKGVDIATPEGTPVRPVAPGVIEFSGWRQGYGNTVIVRHDDGMITLYAHNSTNLKGIGEPVDRGSTIAFSGSTGRTTGPHLHFEAWKNGVNLTASLIPGGGTSTHHHDSDGVRRIVQADGTLLFTNY
jgi:murein DD-endopeptidase MepM/ murein hydrolase activator NlpD